MMREYLVKKHLQAIEKHMIAESDIKSLGHRVVYDIQTGWSINIFGCRADPRLLDGDGYLVRLIPEEE